MRMLVTVYMGVCIISHADVAGQLRQLLVSV